MSRQISATAIGGFVVGILGLSAAVLLFFGGSHFLGDTQKFELIYRSSIQGLRVGAPVTIKGTKIGEVIDIKVKVSNNDGVDVYNSVIVSIQPDILFRSEGGNEKRERAILLNELMDNGLAAQLKIQSFLTGLLYIDVDFFGEDNAPRYEDVETEFTQFPTVATDLQEISRSLQEIDFKGMADDVRNILTGVDRVVNNSDTQALTKKLTETAKAVTQMSATASAQIELLRQDISPAAKKADALLAALSAELPAIVKNLDRSASSLERAMNNLNQTTADARFVLSDDSPVLYSITSAAESLQRAADTLEAASRVIEQQPESILKGRREP